MQPQTSKSIDINRFIQGRIELKNISSKSFIVTVFGDVISQHGQWVWLGSLIESLQPFGLSERLVRTSVFRLLKDDWLQVKKVGRKSYYAFTDTANQHYTKAARRIYAAQSQYADGNWLIVIPTMVSKDKLPALKRQLSWLGFSSLSTGAYAHPSLEQTSLEETIKELKLEQSVIIFSSKVYDQGSESALKKLVQKKWNIDQLQVSYQSLIDDYQQISEQLENNNEISEQQCFLLRIMLIHEYRRILLQDHELPQNMLPENWVGFYANSLVKKLYAKLAKPSTRFIVNNMQNVDGLITKPNNSFNKRFK